MTFYTEDMLKMFYDNKILLTGFEEEDEDDYFENEMPSREDEEYLMWLASKLEENGNGFLS